MKNLLPILLILFSVGFLKAQDYHKIDSLKQILKTLPELDGTDADTTRMDVCIEIGDFYENFIPDSAIWWYASVVDTIFDAKKTNNYPNWAKQNAIALWYIGYIYMNLSNYPTSLLYYEHSLKISEELNDKSGISSCLINLGFIADDQGDNFNAISYYERSLKIKEELGDKSGISACLLNLGVVATYQCDNSAAISYLERSLKIEEELDDKSGISRCLLNRGIVAQNQGDYSAAISYFERSLKIYEELGDKSGISGCLMGIGNIAIFQGNLSSSLSYYERSLKICEELGDKSGISRCLGNLGVVATLQGNYSASISYYEGSLKNFEELGYKSEISGCLMGLGNIATYQGNFSASISYYNRSLKIDEELGDKLSLASNYPKLARAFILMQTPEKAMPLYLKSQEITMSLLKDNFSLLSEKEKELYLYKIRGVFNEIPSFSINFPNQNDSISAVCFNNELILKGLLLKSTQGVLDAVYNSPDTSLKNTYFYLKQLRNQISELQTIPPEERDINIEELEKLANIEERKLVIMSSEFANIQNLFNYKWEDVQKNLKTGEAAIEFVSFTQGKKNDTTVYAALLITPDTKKPQTIRLFEESQLQAIVGANSETGYGFINSLYGTNKDINESLYRIIWKPIEEYLNGINNIYYAPVGVLNKVSFAALGNENGQFLCDKYNLHQLSTTGKLINQEEKSDIKMTAALFGGIDYNTDTVKLELWKYLAGTLKEKEQIEKQFKKNNIAYTSFTGKEAKEENFKELFDSTDAPSILHVSTHGFFYPDPEQVRKEEKRTEKKDSGLVAFRGSDGFGLWMFVQNKNPMMRSGLVFAGANKVWSEDWGRTVDEGVLTAYEVSNMNMRKTDLVVLSACETGLGDIKGSEGVYGLQRAFKMAGVKYIIMSLWQVPDKETVAFMETFYKKLLKTKDVRLSFTETQKEMRKKYDPYFWAAFVLVE